MCAFEVTEPIQVPNIHLG